MSVSYKSGVIVSVDPIAYFDVFSHTHKFKVQLKQSDDTLIDAYVCYDFKSYGIEWWQRGYFRDDLDPRWGDRPSVMACIGDTVEIGWDYHWFTGRIKEYGEPRGEPIDMDVVKTEQMRPDKQAQLDSLGETEHTEIVRSLLDMFEEKE